MKGHAQYGWLAIAVVMVSGALGARMEAFASEPPLTAATRAAREGRYVLAERLYRTAAAGHAPRERLAALRGLETLYLQESQFARALPLSRDAYVNARDGAATGHEVANAALRLAQAYVGLNRHDDARYVLNEATDIADRIGRFDPVVRAKLFAMRAQLAAEGSADHAQFWQEVQQSAEEGLSLVDARILSASYRHAFEDFLIRSWVATDDHQQAISVLQQRFQSAERDNSLALAVTTLDAIARLQWDAGQRTEALATYESALKRFPPQEPSLLQADIAMKYANALDLVEQTDAARSQRVLAANALETLLNKETVPATQERLWLTLLTLDEQLGEVERAAEICESLLAHFAEHRHADHPLVTETLERGAVVDASRGKFEAAEAALQTVLATRRSRSPRDPLPEATTLERLGTVSQALGHFDEAERLAREALALRRETLAEGELVFVNNYRLLGRVAAARGRYDAALAWYEQALETCRLARTSTETRGSAIDRLEGPTLLDISAIYHWQGQIDPALKHCRQALEVHKRTAGTESFSTVGYHTALANLLRLAGRRDEALNEARHALELCRQRDQLDHPSAANVYYHLGLLSLASEEFTLAEECWQKALAIWLNQGQERLAARAQNQLGLLAFRQQRLEDAAERFTHALRLQENDHVHPQERYTTLCNLGGTLRRLGQVEQARTLLERAVELTEAPRSGVVGAEQERAEFFARFGLAFDMLVDWQVADGDIEAAFRTAEQSRNRTFLDQLQIAGIDLRATLEPQHAGLVSREQELNRQLAAIRSQLRTRVASGPREQAALETQLESLERDYANVWTQIRSASPYYRHLLTREQKLLTLAELRQNILRPDELMLQYYLGQQQSYLLIIPPAGRGQVEVLPLVAESGFVSAEGLAQLQIEEDIRGSAGLVASPKAMETAGEPIASVDHVLPVFAARPLNRSLAAWAVGEQLRRVQSGWTGEDRGSAGLVTAPKDETASASQTPPPGSSEDALAQTLLPDRVRSRVEQLQPRRLIIVPDGPLHLLPFESMRTARGLEPRFVLDDFPAISYVASANILAVLRARDSRPLTSKAAVLTAGDPQYGSTQVATIRGVYEQFSGTLHALPGSERECRRVAAAFSQADVNMLLGRDASEPAVAAAMPGRQIVHLAAHGFVDQRHGNLFGAIALSTPEGEDPSDGLLTLAEIHALPLQDCELAVLSACQTHLGTGRPLESEVTLAQAFLAAGSRRVVASHWNVADRSTADLIGRFLENVAKQVDAGEAIAYDVALHEARQSVRANPLWAAPYHWAPFVLVGPGQ